MILFTIIATLVVIAAIIAVVFAGVFGGAALVVFGDIFIFAAIVYLIVKIFRRKKK